MRTISIAATDIPPGYQAVQANPGTTDGTLKLIEGPDPPVLRSEYEDLERRFRLLLAAWIEAFGGPPPGLEREVEPALQTVGTETETWA